MMGILKRPWVCWNSCPACYMYTVYMCLCPLEAGACNGDSRKYHLHSPCWDGSVSSLALLFLNIAIYLAGPVSHFDIGTLWMCHAGRLLIWKHWCLQWMSIEIADTPLMKYLLRSIQIPAEFCNLCITKRGGAVIFFPITTRVWRNPHFIG